MIKKSNVQNLVHAEILLKISNNQQNRDQLPKEISNISHEI